MQIVPSHPEDKAPIIRLFREYGFALQQESWWDWKYLENPHGEAKSFKILHEEKLAGAVAIMPQRFTYAGREMTCLQTVDGLMAREVRGKHLFNDVMGFLLRNRPDQVNDNYFYMSFPSLASSVRAHENAGWIRLADGLVYTFLLRGGSLDRVSKLRVLKPLLTPMLALQRSLLFAGAGRGLVVVEIDRFGPGMVPELPADRVRGVRSPEMLNWRVFDNPRDEMKAYLIRENGVVAGYFVCKILGRNMEIVDAAFTDVRPAYLISLLQKIHRDDIADSVDLLIFGNHRNMALLPRLGYIKRHFTGVAFVQNVISAGLPENREQWEISYLDSDW